MQEKIHQYLIDWKRCGYSDDIPDEVPDVLMRLQLAPSYKAVAMAILKNDHALKTLGYSGTPTLWYGALKALEIKERGTFQGDLF